MAEKYTLYLQNPRIKELIPFFEEHNDESVPFITERITKYLDFPHFFDFFYKDNFPQQYYRMEEIPSKRREVKGMIDFIAKIIIPESTQELCLSAENGIVKINLTSKLLKNPLDAEIHKKEGRIKRKFQLHLLKDS